MKSPVKSPCKKFFRPLDRRRGVWYNDKKARREAEKKKGMEIYEIICGAAVLLLAILIIILCLMQEGKSQDSLTSALGGGVNESFYGQNEGNTREAALAKLTKVLAIIALGIIFCMNVVIPYIMTLVQGSGE